MRRLNGLWTYVFTKAIAEAEKQANERLVIDKEIVAKWLKERDEEAAASAVVATVEPSETEIVEISDDDSDASSSDTSSVSSCSSFGTDAAEEIHARALDSRDDIIVESPDAGDNDESAAAGADANNDTAPWEDFQLDDPNDVLADASAVGLSILDQNKLAFLANLNHRLNEYEESGFADDYLYRQLTMG